VIETPGGMCLTGASAGLARVDEECVTAVVLRDGRRIEADAVVLAVPWHGAPPLLPRRCAPSRRSGRSRASELADVSVHLWLDPPRGWGSAFLASSADGHSGSSTAGRYIARQRIASVTSGARFWDDESDEAIAAEVMAERPRGPPGDACRALGPVTRRARAACATISLTARSGRGPPAR